MPRMDGYEVCTKLRADGRSAHIPVIMLTAKSLSADKVLGLTAGADDYIIKPFDPMELVARVKTTLRRASEMRSLSPLTGLPGNLRIEQEIAHRMERGKAVAVAYADLDNFKSYNDRYGFLRGDEVISLFARCCGGPPRTRPAPRGSSATSAATTSWPWSPRGRRGLRQPGHHRLRRPRPHPVRPRGRRRRLDRAGGPPGPAAPLPDRLGLPRHRLQRPARLHQPPGAGRHRHRAQARGQAPAGLQLRPGPPHRRVLLGGPGDPGGPGCTLLVT
jgi:CheY-like chemotaxis protein